MEIGWGVVGTGEVAGYVAPAIVKSRSGRLVACCSRTVDRAEQFAREHGAERVYGSHEELVRDPEVDAVYVSTPNHLHYPVVLAAAAAGKHVLCEKPMAPTLREAEDMLAACNAAGVILRVGMQIRFEEVIQKVVALVREGRVGTVREVSTQRYSWQRPEALAPWRYELSLARAGVLADVGVHMIDYVQWIVGDRIARVFAMAYPSRSSGQPDATTTVLLEFEGGCQATVRTSRGLPVGANDLQVFGTEGMLATGPIRWVDRHHLTLRTRTEREEHDFAAGDLYLREIEAFAEEVGGRRTIAATGEEGVMLTRVYDAVIRSLGTGAAVEV